MLGKVGRVVRDHGSPVLAEAKVVRSGGCAGRVADGEVVSLFGRRLEFAEQRGRAWERRAHFRLVVDDGFEIVQYCAVEPVLAAADGPAGSRVRPTPVEAPPVPVHRTDEAAAAAGPGTEQGTRGPCRVALGGELDRAGGRGFGRGDEAFPGPIVVAVAVMEPVAAQDRDERRHVPLVLTGR